VVGDGVVVVCGVVVDVFVWFIGCFDGVVL